MKLKTAIFAAVLSLSGGIAVASDPLGNYTISGLANFSCASFLKEDKEDGIDARINEFWIGGFMTAAGLYNDTQKTFLDVSDRESRLYLIRQYCEKNPLDQIADAVEQVAEQLIDRAGRR